MRHACNENGEKNDISIAHHAPEYSRVAHSLRRCQLSVIGCHVAQTLLSVPDNRQPTTRAQRAYHSPCSASRPSPSAPPPASRSSSSPPRWRRHSERSPAATASPPSSYPTPPAPS